MGGGKKVPKPKGKTSKSKSSPKNSPQNSPQGSRSVNFKGSTAIYNAVPTQSQASDSEDANNSITNQPTSSSNVGSPSAGSKGKAPSPKNKSPKNKPNSQTSTSNQNKQQIANNESYRITAPLPSLDDDEYEFFQLVRTGGVSEVANYLVSEKFQKMDINKTDKKGYTVLHYAVRRQDENMVSLLLEQPGILLYDTILHAVKEKNVEITKLLLNLHDKVTTQARSIRNAQSLGGGYQSVPNNANNTNNPNTTLPPKVKSISSKSGIKSSIAMNSRSIMGSPTVVTIASRVASKAASKSNASPNASKPNSGSAIKIDDEFDSEFPPVITPFMLAAQVGSEELIDLFYSRGDRLEDPNFHHNEGCACDICAKLEGDQDLTRAYQRYHLIKALAQPEYICFLARREKIDPVNYAIDKIIRVRRIIDADPAFAPLFENFAKELEAFISKLLQCCRNTTEVSVFMSPKDTEKKERLPHFHPRLWYTVGLKLKDFVAQPNCQILVYKLWATDDWPDWETYGDMYRLFNIVIRICTFPLIALFLMVGQETGVGKTLKAPVSRFLTYIGSYIFFLCLVAFQVMYPYQRCNDEDPYFQIHDSECKQRGAPNMGTEWPLVIYVLSFYLSTLKRQGLSWYWSMRWNWLELVSQLCFTITFAFWGYSWIWAQLPENQPVLKSVDRLMWPHDCSEILGECFLAVSCLLASFRLLRFLIAYRELGPLQIRLGMLIGDFVKVCLLLVVVIGAFSSGMMAIYMPYKGFHGLDLEDARREKAQDDAFQDPMNAFKTFFFGLYEHGGPETTYIRAWNVKNGSEVDEIHHKITEITGMIIYVCYTVIGSTMVFGMVSGYFSHRDEEFEERAKEEWLFARTELYLTFVKDTILPPPFNLLPTIGAMKNCGSFMSNLGSKTDPKSSCTFRQCCYVTENEKVKEWKEMAIGYRKLILQLLFRFKNLQEEEEAKEQATADDVLEIGEELAEIKDLLHKGFQGEI